MNHLPPNESVAYPVRRHTHHDDGLQDDGNLLNTVLNMPVRKDRIVTRTPEEPFRLTFVDVTCLVVNRTIGEDDVLNFGNKYWRLTLVSRHGRI